MAESNASADPSVINKTKIYHGVFKQQLVVPVGEDEDGDGEDGPTASTSEKNKKKKSKSKDSPWSKKQKSDPNAPSVSRIPLPEMSDDFKTARQNAMNEIAKRVKLNQEKLPSICFYTFLNAHSSVCCTEISEDSSTLCAGFNDSSVQLWSLSEDKLKPLKKAKELEQLDRESDDILEQILDDSSSSSRLTFLGHTGPVYNTNFSPDKKLLLSCSEDATIRLWGLHTWSNLVVYRLGGFPFWDVKFGPYGYYFATAGSDRCALLWVMDRQQPLRMFVGHTADVNCVNFHPNSNYIVSGSDDRTVRLWDVTNGADGHVMLFDIGSGRLMMDLPAHEGIVHSLAFSRENTVLASGGMDSKIALHYLTPLHNEIYGDSQQSKQTLAESMRMPEYSTKSTPVLNLHFTRRNLLLGVGSYGQY